MVFEWLLPIVLAGFSLLVILTVTAIIEVAVEYIQDAETIVIVDPATSHELERIAAQKSSKPHKRFAFDRQSGKAVLVASNKIADELKDEDVIEVDVH